MQSLVLGNLQVAYWLSTEEDQSTPVVIFSHGFGGCSWLYNSLLSDIADAGYAVFSPIHDDSGCLDNNVGKHLLPPIPFDMPFKWNDTQYKNRKNDIEKMLSILPRDSRFDKLNWKKLALSGHSLGGYTAIAMAGGWPSWKDTRVKAVLAFSPYSSPFVTQRTMKNLQVPIMFQGGDTDWLTPQMKSPDGAYAQTQSSKIYLELERAEHNAWISADPKTHRDSISFYSVAFLDYALKDKPFPEELKIPHNDVIDVRSDLRANP